MYTFYNHIKAIASSPYSPRQIQTKIGPAYLTEMEEPYADVIHYERVAESANHINHTAEVFKKNTQWRSEQSVYMGVAGFVNLFYLANLNPDYAVLFDINCLQKLFWKNVLDALKNNDTHHDFKRWFPTSETQLQEQFNALSFERPKLKKTGWRTDDIVTSLYRTFCTDLEDFISHSRIETSWLYSTDQYQTVKTMAEQERIGLATFDMRDPVACGTLSRHVQNFNTQSGRSPEIDVVYASNAMLYPNWIGDGYYTSREQIERNIASMTSSKGFMITAEENHDVIATPFSNVLQAEAFI